MSERAPPLVDSRAAFRAAVLWGFGEAIAAGARRIVCADADFAEWPFDDAGMLAGLTAWAKRPQRQLVLLAGRYDALARRCPRFANWRADWAHAMDVRLAPEDDLADLPCVLASDAAVLVRLIDPQHWRGQAVQDERSARQWCESLDQLLQRSEPGWAVRTLGL